MPILLLALSLRAAAPRPPADGPDDVVVVARQPVRWRAALVIEHEDRLRCRVTRSTGNPTTDAQGCDAMQRCFAAERPHILAASAPGLAPPTRRRQLTQARQDLDACFKAVSYRFATMADAPPPVPDTAAPNDPVRSK